ncbi:hypothetical protein PF002_g18007 [Phytophthora fragariae]|uniref:RxLR effector protein n=3 Tax=Phytophthora fragariae TaxID=53985 RepID=A0A6A3Y6X9_9STRA|nr:hypothetical protein PF011_g1167 [Phytophthora fragariae]KAE9196289.1 hypothetical protein PF004_g20183 [Phytophthora fragariae]KAE9213287.1 hypothetical protein PF002_g18007 [Phytophthora fragariae]KAE9288345.1 hypothetical protein PF001_g20557 [Phytophthora fragariae]
MRSSWMMIVSAIALVMASPIGAISNVRAANDVNTANAGVQPGKGIGNGNFVNVKTAQTPALPAPASNFKNTAFNPSDENRIVGDVATAGSYSGMKTMSAVTKAGESSSKKDESTNTGTSAASTTPVILAVAAACVVAVAAVVAAKKRADNKLSTPRTPEDDMIYYQVEPVVKPGYFQVNRQLTPPLEVL